MIRRPTSLISIRGVPLKPLLRICFQFFLSVTQGDDLFQFIVLLQSAARA